MTPIKEQIELAIQRMKEYKEKRDTKEYYNWKGYLEGLNYAKLWYESEEGKKEFRIK